MRANTLVKSFSVSNAHENSAVALGTWMNTTSTISGKRSHATVSENSVSRDFNEDSIGLISVIFRGNEIAGTASAKRVSFPRRHFAKKKRRATFFAGTRKKWKAETGKRKIFIHGFHGFHEFFIFVLFVFLRG